MHRPALFTNILNAAELINKLLKKPVEPAPAGRAGVARAFCGRIETTPNYRWSRPLWSGWARDTQKPLLDQRQCLCQQPVNHPMPMLEPAKIMSHSSESTV
jgi:hypothetical protein